MSIRHCVSQIFFPEKSISHWHRMEASVFFRICGYESCTKCTWQLCLLYQFISFVCGNMWYHCQRNSTVGFYLTNDMSYAYTTVYIHAWFSSRCYSYMKERTIQSQSDSSWVETSKYNIFINEPNVNHRINGPKFNNSHSTLPNLNTIHIFGYMNRNIFGVNKFCFQPELYHCAQSNL